MWFFFKLSPFLFAEPSIINGSDVTRRPEATRRSLYTRAPEEACLTPEDEAIATDDDERGH